MHDLDIRKVRVYAVGPAVTPRFRFTGRTADLFMTYTIVRITARNGLEGAGGVDTESAGTFDRRFIESFRPLIGGLIGKSALDREALAHALLEARREPIPMAESLIDIALWDLTAQQAGLPLYRLLGGARNEIPAYASSPVFDTPQEYLDYAGRVRSLGYPAVKFHTRGELSRDLEVVRAVHGVFGASGLRFMLDLEERYSLEEALVMGSELSRLGYTWLEAPLPDTELEGYRELRSRVRVPVMSSGNSIVELDRIRRALETGCWSAVRTDPCIAGGITAARKIVALSEAFGAPAELQSYGYPLSQSANLHLMLGVGNCSYFEHPVPVEHFDYGCRSPVRVDEQGYARTSEAPGLGLDLDWERIEADAFASLEAE